MSLEQYTMKMYAFSRSLLLMMREIQNEDTMVKIFEKIEEHIAMFNRTARESNSVRCRGIYKELDMFIEKEKPPEVVCRAGCAACCGQYVAVSRDEARHLVHVAKAKGIDIDWDRAKRQAHVPEGEWHHLPLSDQPCVFLDAATRQCRVYFDRPLACRKYFVVSDPKLCDINTNRDTLVAVWPQVDSEIVATAWMTVAGCESLPKALLEEVGE